MIVSVSPSTSLSFTSGLIVSEQPPGRFSLGSIRLSDAFNPLELLPSDDAGIDQAFFPAGALDDATDPEIVADATTLERQVPPSQRGSYVCI